MTTFSDANWDTPPGTGYLTGAVLIVSAVLTVIMTLRPSQAGAAVEAHWAGGPSLTPA